MGAECLICRNLYFKKADSPLISLLVTVSSHDAQLNLCFLQGFIFVDLKSEAEVQKALKRKKEYIGKRCLFLLVLADVSDRVLRC